MNNYEEKWGLSKVMCDALCNLVPFVQFKKREKHPRRAVNFSKAAGWGLIWKQRPLRHSIIFSNNLLPLNCFELLLRMKSPRTPILNVHSKVWEYFWHLKKPFKKAKKCFLFHLKSSFRSQDIYIFVLSFWSCKKPAWLER